MSVNGTTCDECCGPVEGMECSCGAFYCELCDKFRPPELADGDEPNQCTECIRERAIARAEAYQDMEVM